MNRRPTTAPSRLPAGLPLLILPTLLIFLSTACFVGLRLDGLSRSFELPINLDPEGWLLSRLEYAPLERLGLADRGQSFKEPGGAVSLRSSQGNAGSGKNLVLLRVHEPGIDSRIRTLILSSAPVFPPLSLDQDLRIVDSPMRALNKRGTVSGKVEEGSPDDFIVGYRLLAVEGHPVNSVQDYETAFANHHDFVLIRYTLEAPPGSPDAGTPIEFIIWKVDWKRATLIFISGVAIALLGLLVIFLQPETYSARGFLIFALTLGIFSMFRSIPPIYRNEFESWTFSILMALLPMACGIFLVTFTPLRLILRRAQPVTLLLLAWGALLFALNQLKHPGLNHFGGGPGFLFWALTMLAFVVAPLPADYLMRWRKFPLGAMDRQRGQTIRLATLVAFLPIAIQTIYQEITKTSGWVWTDLCTLLFPAIVAFAVLRRGLLMVDEIVLHGLVLVLLSAGVGLGYSGLMALASHLAPRVGFFDTGMFNGFLLGALTFSAGGVQLASRKWVATRMNRLPAEYESLISGAEDQTLTIIDPLPFCERLCQSVHRATGGAHVTVFACIPDKRERWWLAARSDNDARGPRSRLVGPALNLAASEKRMIARDTILDDIEHAKHRRTYRAGFRDTQASLLFPLVFENEVWGILAVGDRPDLKPYRNSEQVALKRIVEQAAVRMREATRRLILQRHNRRIARPRIAELYPECPPRIGPYRIDRVLGKGGMALVFRGWREGRPYAVKVPNLSVQSDMTMMRRFAHEARTLIRIRHPNVITVDEVGDDEGEPWIAMEYLPMGTLADHLKKQGALTEELARTLTRQIALGLAAAQAESVIHRDIKPQNIFFISSDTVKVGDFGLAKVGDMTTLTTIAKLMGTPGYIAPEIWENRGADWASDQYALGVTFFEMLAGERPFKADSMMGLMKSHLFMTAPDVRTRGIEAAESTAAILARMLAKNPDDRFSSYAELVAALS